MYRIIMKNQKIYYLVGIIALLLLELFGSVMNDVNTTGTISLGEFLIKYDWKYCDEYRILSVINACCSEWFYTLISVIAGIPAVSFAYEQIKNGSLKMFESRMGKSSYIWKQISYCIMSSAIVCVAAYVLYVVIAAWFFDIMPENLILISDDNQVLETISGIFNNGIYSLLHAVMMSLLLVLITYLYQDLLFDISVVFIISYKTRFIAMNQNYMVVTAGIILLIVIYHVMWKMRGEKI